MNRRKRRRAEHYGRDPRKKGLSNHCVRGTSCHVIYGVAGRFSTSLSDPSGLSFPCPPTASSGVTRFPCQLDQPARAKCRERADVNVMPRGTDAEPHCEIGGRQPIGSLLRPLDEPKV